MKEIKTVEETKLVIMTFDEWVEKYKPVLDAEGSPRAFDTTGPDYDEVIPYPANQVWTRVDCDGSMPITSGWHFVNRDAYFLTEVPFEDGIEIEVTDDFALTDDEKLAEFINNMDWGGTEIFPNEENGLPSLKSVGFNYRVFDTGCDDGHDILVEDGGVASTHNAGEYMLLTLYQGRISLDSDMEDIWTALGENDHVYLQEFSLDAPFKEMVEYALDWLVAGCITELKDKEEHEKE
jgi:hypothetical protein